MCDFFNPKNVTIGSGILKKNAIFLTHWSENVHFTWVFRVFDGYREFSIEKGNFCFDQCQSQQ